MTPEAWGQGFMSEALSAALDYGFGPLGLNRVEAFVNRGEPSVRGGAAASGDFDWRGVLREYEFSRGRFVDQECYSLLARER